MQERQDIEKSTGEQAPETLADKKKSRTFGNKVFDWAVWPPIQWIGVWGLALLVGNSAQNGSGVLNKWFNASVNWLKPKFQLFDKPFAKKIWGSGSGSKEWASATTLLTALWMGSNSFLPVTKYFEDRRGAISSWFDKAFHKPPQNSDTMQKEPKQTWSSLIKGRLSGTVFGYLAFIALGPGRAIKVQNALGDKAANIFMKWRPHADRGKVNKWANLAIFDLLFTCLAAAVHYFTSRTFARKSANNITAAENTVIVADNVELDSESQGKPMANKELRSKKAEQKQHVNWVSGEEIRRYAETANTIVAP